MSRGKSGYLLKGLLGVIVAVLIFKAFRHYSTEILHHVARIDLARLGCGLLLCVLYRVLNSSGWVLVLRAIQQPMPLIRGMRLWLLSESMRWLPGSVWGFCSRVVQAAKSGIPAGVASASLPLELLLTVVAWSFVALFGILGSGASIKWAGVISIHHLIIGVAGAAILGGLVALVLFKLPESRIARKVRSLRSELCALRAIRLNWGRLCGVLCLYIGLCCLNGIAFLVVLSAVSPEPANLLAIIAANAFGWLVGFLAIGAPGGIGVREASSALLLSTMMPLPTAIAASTLWRMVMIVDEALCLGACLAPSVVRLVYRVQAPMDHAG